MLKPLQFDMTIKILFSDDLLFINAQSPFLSQISLILPTFNFFVLFVLL